MSAQAQGREYEVVDHTRAGKDRRHRYSSDEPLEPGSVLRLEGRYWLVERIDDGEPPRAFARPARYRIRLRHPDGREELGTFRRFRSDAPRLGHTFTTIEEGQPIGWEVTDERLATDDGSEPYLDLVAERDYLEVEELPDHELEHTLAGREGTLPDTAVAMFSQAERNGYSIELVGLEPGELPDWEEARRYIDSLTLDEVEDDLLELCGVDPDHDPREGWLETVKGRLRADLESLRADIDGEQDEIEEWDFLDGRIFAAIGSVAHESDPDSAYGWLCRLVDASALGAAGFQRVRKPELELLE